MQRHRNEEGWGLIFLIGMTAALALLAATMVMAVGNQEGRTSAEKAHKNSVYYAEGVIDSAVQYVKSQPMPKEYTDDPWMTMSDLTDALTAAGLLPAGATITSFLVYDNSNPIRGVFYDANDDGLMWLEVTLVYKGKTTRLRCLVSQLTQNVVKSFPKAVVYSDSGIKLDGSSDVYAVDPDGVTPYNPANHGGAYSTTIMAGGGKYSASGAQDFVANASANLAAPTSTAQSVNVNVNGSVSPSGKFAGTVIGGVGLLSDYFDQAAQADLGDEAQAGESHSSAPPAPTPAPTAPSAPTPTPTATPTTTILNGWTSTSSTTPVDVSSTDYKVSGNLTLSRGTSTTKRTFKFRKLYVTGNLTLTGPVEMTCTDFLRVDGTITINNTTSGTTAVIDSFQGAVYAGSTSSSAASGGVTINASSSFYTGGAMTFSNTATNAASLYVKGALGVTGNSTLTVGTSVAPTFAYSGGALTISGATSGLLDQIYGRLWVAGTGASSVSGTMTLNATEAIYGAGPLALNNTAVTSPHLYIASTSQGNTNTSTPDALSISSATTVNASSDIYSAGTIVIKGPTTTGLLYAGAAWVDADPSDNPGYSAALAITGNVAVKATATVVSLGDFRITGATTAVTDYLGRLWAAGPNSKSTWSGYASVWTTNYLASGYNDVNTAANPMYLTILARSGTFTDKYGDVWLTGNAGTSNIACEFDGPGSGSSQVWCPLLATTEKTKTTGRMNFGSMTRPMVYYMMCDNDELYSNDLEWGSSGTFYGLMVIMEACATFSGGNGTTPVVVGAVFNGTPYKSGTSDSVYDIQLTGSTTIAYDQAILDAVTNSAITTMTTTTQIVKGSWQQIAVN